MGLMLINTLYTLCIGWLVLNDTLLKAEAELIHQIDFEAVVMDYMLSFLLFAGALHTNFQDLKEQRWPIIAFCDHRRSCIYFSDWYFHLLFTATSRCLDKFYHCLLFARSSLLIQSPFWAF
ncbi:MAG: hypothetical protein R3B93_28790 [Bacteroidia bacterium]